MEIKLANIHSGDLVTIADTLLDSALVENGLRMLKC